MTVPVEVRAIQILDDQHWHALSRREIADPLETDPDEGLDRFAVEHRRAWFGADALTPSTERRGRP